MALLAFALVVFSILVAVVHTVTERRQQRRIQQQWEARERSLHRRP
jgi:heme exporter protein D